jgi:hypothetical protein
MDEGNRRKGTHGVLMVRSWAETPRAMAARRRADFIVEREEEESDADLFDGFTLLYLYVTFDPGPCAQHPRNTSY